MYYDLKFLVYLLGWLCIWTFDRAHLSVSVFSTSLLKLLYNNRKSWAVRIASNFPVYFVNLDAMLHWMQVTSRFRLDQVFVCHLPRSKCYFCTAVIKMMRLWTPRIISKYVEPVSIFFLFIKLWRWSLFCSFCLEFVCNCKFAPSLVIIFLLRLQKVVLF